MYRSLDPKKKFIAKKVRQNSNELAILDFLNTIQPKSDHIISLLDSFHGQSRQWVVLPKMTRIAEYVWIDLKRLKSKAVQLCLGLIKGLAYLHERCIAHRDIKPDNLVVDRDLCLKIIDFDSALQVEDEDDKVDDYCGTKYWMAPEVEERLIYSPIKADRWSCGRALLSLLDELGKEDKHLEAFAGNLMEHNPRQRPSLLEWRSYLPPPLSDVGDGDVRNINERKASRPRQGSSGKDTKPSEAKKQRVAGRDE